MTSTFSPMTIGEIFDTTFSMIGKTFLRSAAIALTFIAFPILLLMISAHHFYSTMPGFTIGGAGKHFTDFAPMFAGSFYFGSASLLLAVAALLAEVAISIVIGSELRSERVSYRDALRKTFDGRWLNGIGEGFLKMVIFFGFGFFAAIVGGIIVMVVGKSPGSSGLVSIMFAILLIFVIVAVIFYFIVRLYFALTAVALQEVGPVEALKKSWFLVGDHWWKTLGLLILFYVVSSFAISLITLPVTFGSMWGTYKHFFTFLGQTGGRIPSAELSKLQSGFGPMIGISTGLSSILSLLITPAFTVVMYFDLRARHNDIPDIESPADSEDTPPVKVI